MNADWNSTINITGGGYSCPRCGGWISSGMTHLCLEPSYQPQYTPPVFVDMETKGLLRRIADALEKIANKP